MADQSLVAYINQLLQAGYDINSIKERLISSGYDVNIINEAVSYAYQGAEQAAPKPSFADHLKSRKFIVALTAIFLIIIGSFAILMLSGGESLPIDLSVSPVSSLVSAGSQVEFAKSLVNIEGTGMVSFNYAITDSSGRTIATGEERVSTQAIPRKSSLAVPADAASGSYTLKAIAVYGDQRSEKSFTFTVEAVQAEIIQEEEQAPEFEAPPAGEEADNDKDGIPDSIDEDDDNDGIPDAEDAQPLDHDNDGTIDTKDVDADDDGILDKFDYYLFDRDNDGIPDIEDNDDDNDGILDPEDSYPFDYDNDGVLDKDDDAKTYEVPEQASGSSTCSNNIQCNDFDVCTIDTCAGGSCEHQAQTPCCGDFVCEEGETPLSCSKDCKAEVQAPPPGTDDIIVSIISDSPNPEAAAKRCSELEKQSLIDNCYLELAKSVPRSTFCELIKDLQIKDTCYMFFVMNHAEYALCDKVNNRYLQNSCYSIKGTAELMG